MKILVLQLARPGDIFCTGPALQALARTYPQAELHILVRKKFAAAARVLKCVDHIWEFDSENWVGPLLNDPTDFRASISSLSQFIETLKNLNFERVINLSFSPSSSFITHLVSSENASVRGYTRTSDFYLHIPDEASRYFRIHVGQKKGNKIHVVDLFAMVAGVNLTLGDHELFNYQYKPGEAIVCHIGASQEAKTWPVKHWEKFIKLLLANKRKVILVGGSDDKNRVEELRLYLGESFHSLTDLVGQTDFKDLAKVLSQAKVFIGADSGPSHVASLVGCPVLGLSLGDVKFWETGPFSKNSRVICNPAAHDLTPEMVLGELENLVAGRSPSELTAVCDGSFGVRYIQNSNIDQSFEKKWSVTSALVFGNPNPDWITLNEGQGLLILYTLCSQVEKLLDSAILTNEKQKKLLELDSRIRRAAGELRNLAPLFDTFYVEMENIPPGKEEEIIESTKQCYQRLKENIYLLIKPSHDQIERKEVSP